MNLQEREQVWNCLDLLVTRDHPKRSEMSGPSVTGLELLMWLEEMIKYQIKWHEREREVLSAPP